MKINSIFIENIASLKGSHFIDFDQINKTNNSIFAITGDTGSGKSTILNCISLALYGQTYKKSLNQYDYISLGEALGKVELAFTQNGKSYSTLWECRVRKQNGEFLKSPKSKRAYFEITGNDKNAIEQSPESIIGLDFDQFCQTIILNQGEFARFLSSSFSDRKIILEKLYKADKLKLLNPYVRNKINEITQVLDIINSKLETFEGATQDVNQEELSQKKIRLKEVTEDQKHISQIKSFSVDLCKLIQNHETNQERLIFEQENISKIVKAKNELVIATKKTQELFENAKEATNKELPRLYQAREFEKQIIQLKKHSSENKDKEKELKSVIKESKEQLSACKDLNKKKEELINEIIEKYTLDEEDIIETRLFKVLKEEALNLNNEYISNSKELSTFEKRKTDLLEQIKQLEAQSLESEKLISLNPIDSLKETKSQLEQALRRTESKIVNSESLASELSGLNRLKQQNNQLEKDLKEKLHMLDKAQQEANESLMTVQDALSYNRILEYKTLLIKESIKEGKCLICENTQIDHIHKNEAHLVASTKIQTLNEKVLTLKGELDELIKEQLISNEKLTHSRQNLNSTLSLYIAKSLSLFEEEILEEKDILIIKNSSQQEKIRNEEKLKKCEFKIQETITLIAKNHEQSKYLSTLKKEFDLTKDQLSHIQERKNIIVQKANTFIEDFTKKTKIRVSKISECHEIFEDLIRGGEYQNELTHMHEKAISLEKSLHLNMLAQEELEKRDQSIELQIKELEQKILTITSGQEIESSIKELENRLKKSELEANESKEKLKEVEITHSGAKSKINTYIDQFKEIESAFISSHKDLIEQIKKSKLETVPLFQSLKESFTINTISLDLYLSVTKSLEEIFEELNQNKEIIVRYITEKELLIQRAIEIKQQSEKLILEKKKLLPEKEDWEKLYVLLGRDEFRNFVLSYVEKMLIIQTNNELKTLYDGRYSLEQFVKESKTSPEFYIIDRFNGGATRKISTLSGGETFMVSLAMAFALAELTRGESQIDSFFIDEGFGTLDEDSIDDVLNTLHEIEVRGKQIGLISHVKTMTQRIPVNIHLNKNTQGNSQISIIYN